MSHGEEKKHREWVPHVICPTAANRDHSTFGTSQRAREIFLKEVLACHPDRGGSNESFIRLHREYLSAAGHLAAHASAASQRSALKPKDRPAAATVQWDHAAAELLHQANAAIQKEEIDKASKIMAFIKDQLQEED